MNSNLLAFIEGFQDFNPKRIALGMSNMVLDVFVAGQSPELFQELEAQSALLLWGFLSGSAEHDMTINARRCGLVVTIMYDRDEAGARNARIQFDVASNVSETWAARGYMTVLEVPRSEIHSPCPLCGEDGWTFKTADAWKRPYSRAIREYSQSLCAKWTPITPATVFTPDDWKAAWNAKGFVRAPQALLDQYPPRARRFVSAYSVPETIEFGGIAFRFFEMASELYSVDDGSDDLIFGELTFDGGATFECLIDPIVENVTLFNPDSPDDKRIYANVDLETFFRSLLTAVQWEASVETQNDVSRKDINALKSALKGLDAAAFKGRNACFWPNAQPFSREFLG